VTPRSLTGTLFRSIGQIRSEFPVLDIADLSTLILEKQIALGGHVTLDRVIEALLVDAATDFKVLMRGEAWTTPEFQRVASSIPRQAIALIPKITAIERPVPSPARPEQVYLVLDAMRTSLKSIKTSGIGSRPRDLWHLLFLDALGVAMPDIANALRERRTRNSKERLPAKDDKYLWKLRRLALRGVADTVAPLLPPPTSI
jgi:hypothetical protein